MVRTLKIYCFNNVPVYHAAVLAVVRMSYIPSLVLIYWIDRSLYLLTTFLQLSLPVSSISDLLQSDLFCSKVFFVAVVLFFGALFLFCIFLDSTYKSDHTVFVFLGLISLSITPSRSIHVIAIGAISSFFYTESYPIVCACVCVCITHCNFFMHSSIGGH